MCFECVECFLKMWEHECMTSTAWGRVTWLCCLSVCVCCNSAHVMNSWKHTDILCVSVCECAMMKIPIHSYLFWQADEFWVLGVTVAQSFVCVWAENIGIYNKYCTYYCWVLDLCLVWTACSHNVSPEHLAGFPEQTSPRHCSSCQRREPQTRLQI